MRTLPSFSSVPICWSKAESLVVSSAMLAKWPKASPFTHGHCWFVPWHSPSLPTVPAKAILLSLKVITPTNSRVICSNVQLNSFEPMTKTT